MAEDGGAPAEFAFPARPDDLEDGGAALPVACRDVLELTALDKGEADEYAERAWRSGRGGGGAMRGHAQHAEGWRGGSGAGRRRPEGRCR